MADLHVPLRAGSTSRSSAGSINYILENGREFREYVKEYTNAPAIIDEEFRDTEDLDGLFSGFDAENGVYDIYELGLRRHRRGDRRRQAGAGCRRSPASRPTARTGSSSRAASRRRRTRTCEHPQLRLPDPQAPLQRATRPRWSSRSAAFRAAQFLEVAEALCENSGRERTSAIVYSVGWTQHTVGVQYIRSRGDHPAAAGQHGAARAAGSWRCAGTPTSRARRTSRRCSTSCRATSRCRTRTQHADPRRRSSELNGPSTGAWGDLDAVHDQPAEGLVGRRPPPRRTTSASTTCRGSTATTRNYATMLRMLDGRGEGLLRRRREPGGGLRQRQAPAPGDGQARLARGARHQP